MKRLSQVFYISFIVLGVSLGVVEQAAADYAKEPIQELLDTDKAPVDSFDRDYSIDNNPQIPPPDTEDVMDANDAEVTTPIASFIFWTMMALFGLGLTAYILVRFGDFNKQRT